MTLRKEPPSDASLNKSECKNHDCRKVRLLETPESLQEESLRKFSVLEEIKIVFTDLAANPGSSMIRTDLRE